MSEDFFRDLELSFQTHDELINQRGWQLLDDLWELDWKIIRLEEYILSNLDRHPELYESYSIDNFLLYHNNP